MGDTSEVAHGTDSLLSQCCPRCHCGWKICNVVPGMVLPFAELQVLLAVTGHIRPPAQTNKRTVQPFLLTSKSSPNPVWIGFGDTTITEGDIIGPAG